MTNHGIMHSAQVKGLFITSIMMIQNGVSNMYNSNTQFHSKKPLPAESTPLNLEAVEVEYVHPPVHLEGGPRAPS